MVMTNLSLNSFLLIKWEKTKILYQHVWALLSPAQLKSNTNGLVLIHLDRLHNASPQKALEEAQRLDDDILLPTLLSTV